MDKIINVGIPHIGEQIFSKLKISTLLELRFVSQTWKEHAENVLLDKLREPGMPINPVNLVAAKCYNCLRITEKDRIELFRLLLELDHPKTKNIDWNARCENDRCERTSLIKACDFDKPRIVQLLLEFSDIKSIDLNAQDDDGATAFFAACAGGKANIVNKFLALPKAKNIDLNKTEKDGFNGFMAACSEGNKEVVEQLLDFAEEKGIELNARSKYVPPAFELACRRGHKDVVELLLDYRSAGNPIDLPSVEEMEGWNCDDEINKLVRKALLFKSSFKRPSKRMRLM